jgi:hypothetical protein
MIVRSLDGGGDWTFGQGLNNYVSENDAIAQSISTRLKSFIGDCFWATDAGIDWWNLLGSRNQIPLNLAINSILLNTFGVTGIVEISVDLDETRNLSIRYTVSTIYTPRLTRVVGLLLLTDQDGAILQDQSGENLSA